MTHEARKWPLCISLVLLLALFGAGCQSTSEVGDGPILPLFSSLDAPRAVRIVAFGAPKALDEPPGPDLQLASAAQPAKENISEVDELRVPDQILHVCFAREHPIDLCQAFALANVENPTIGLSDELVRATLAEQMVARAMLFPTLNAGATLSIHRGHLLAASGTLRDVDRESLYYGAGADVRGAGAVAIPGVRLVGHLGDAVLAPRVAEYRVQASRFDAAATRNNILLAVANAYLGLVGAEARLLALRQSEVEIAQVARLTTNFAAKGAGREADALRSQGELAMLQTNLQRAEEEVVARATELARLLSTDPTVRLRPEDGTTPLIQLVDDQTPLDALVETAVANRPEISARIANIALNETRLRQERIRPFLPTVGVGFSAGEFGGGSNQVGYRLSQFDARTDLDVVAVWNVRNFGLGNRAVANRVRAEVGAAEAQRMQVIDQVRREIAEAFAQSRASRHQLDIAKRRVDTAQQAFRQDLTRTKDGLGRIVEVLSSFTLLTTARQELVQAMVGYSQAQFELYVALGGTPSSPTAQGKAPE